MPGIPDSTRSVHDRTRLIRAAATPPKRCACWSATCSPWDKHRVSARCDARNAAPAARAGPAGDAPGRAPVREHLGKGQVDRRPAVRGLAREWRW